MVGSGFTSHFGVISEAGRFGRSVLETGRGSKSSRSHNEFTTFSTKFRTLNLERRLRGLGINLEVLISDVINQGTPPWSSGPGRRDLIPETSVRVRQGVFDIELKKLVIFENGVYKPMGLLRVF